MLKYVLASAFLIGLATPAIADYFIVQNTSTKACSIVSAEEKTDDMVVIGTKNYQTVKEAEEKMKAAKECQAP